MSSASKSSFCEDRDAHRREAVLQQRDLPLELGWASRERLALYSVYSRVRKDCREMSNATARWVGFSALSRLMSIDRKP